VTPTPSPLRARPGVVHDGRVTLAFARLGSPIGILLLVGGAQGLAGVHVAGHARAPDPDAAGWVHDEDLLAEPLRQLQGYFAGERTHFDLAVDPGAATSWQRTVWHGLETIPYGATVTYGQLATMIGRPSAARAVGTANGANPVSIVVPCHRVVAKAGLGGYGWGPERKRWLLDHEARTAHRLGMAPGTQLPLG
jgi:methylated-DNA-[protein]-cysteine S-methyltransferase